MVSMNQFLMRKYFICLDLDDLELELRLARLEYLMDRRPLMLNSVLLRQNPHNVNEWIKRVKLYGEQYEKVIETFTTAVQTVDPKICTGKLQDLWIAFAQFYDKYQQPEEARFIYDKAIKVNFRNVDDLAAIWCAWCEMEIQHEKPDEAIKLMERATVLPKHKVCFIPQPKKTFSSHLFLSGGLLRWK